MTSISLDELEEKKNDRYRFFDSPDGEDCLKKLVYCSKAGAVLGVFASTLDVILFSHPKGYGSILARYAYTTLPVTGMAATFAAATCASANIRKKDDKVNYAIGGIATGGVLGAWKKSYKFGVYGAIALAGFAILIKDSYQNDWNIFPRYSRKEPYTPFWIRQDWSILSDPGRTLKRGDE